VADRKETGLLSPKEGKKEVQPGARKGSLSSKERGKLKKEDS